LSNLTRRHNLRTLPQGERGAAAVEFAIVLPLLILLVFGIVEFAIAYNRQQGLHAAAREGARVAALPQTSQADIVDRVHSALDGVLNDTDLSAATITVTPASNQPCDDAPPGTHVVVTVSAPNTLAIPLFSNATITLTGKGEFRCE
jgi:Flp pilus assembly protein TadG